MYWQSFPDMPSPKVEPDSLNSCSICCAQVPASEMWGIRDAEKGGWVVCVACHALYAGDVAGAWQEAQDRWDSEGPCA